MEKAPIQFFAEDITFDLKGKSKARDWISQIAENEGYNISNLNFIFCNDQYLHAINKTYLKHDSLTDIITFDLSENKGALNGDIFISIERVKENAAGMGIHFREELDRVMVHGVLHLSGYDDRTVTLKQQMTEKEDFYLSLRP